MAFGCSATSKTARPPRTYNAHADGLIESGP
jgi:hypothetical protein